MAKQRQEQDITKKFFKFLLTYPISLDILSWFFTYKNTLWQHKLQAVLLFKQKEAYQNFNFKFVVNFVEIGGRLLTTRLAKQHQNIL